MPRALDRMFYFLCIFTISMQAALGRPVVSYDIKARLDPAAKTVSGEERLAWLNTSPTAVSSVPFHLYLNAFLNNRSTFMRARGGPEGRRHEPEDWGYCRVKSIRLEGGADLTPTLRYIQPDDGNADDRTVMEVRLPRPVKPGEMAVFLIDFESKLPRVIARSGFHGDFFMVAQWFPKVGVMRAGGWNCHQYHANTEFFADFGTYRVEITTPREYVVGATGLRVGERKNADGTATTIHEQGNIHDFAWTACPDFVEYRERFSLENPRVDTEMILLIHRRHEKFLARHLEALKFGLEFYSRSYGGYPYPTITLVDPAPGAQEAGGMEYPTLFTSISLAWLPDWILLPEMVTIHEFGHNYWYGMVGSNEFEEAWLDEGINTYSEIKALEKFRGGRGWLLDFWGLRLSDLDMHRSQVFLSGKYDPVVRRSWDFISGGSYGLNVYSKAGLTLLMLERMLGEEVMDRVMRTYFERWRFGHPLTSDFIAAAEEVSGRDLKGFFEQFLFSPDTLDYAVDSLSSRRVPDLGGLDDPGGKTAAGSVDKSTKAGFYRNEVVVRRLGEHVFPQEVEVVFDGGRKVTEHWDGRERWKRFVWTSPDRLRSALLDPREVMVLDTNMANNSRTLDPNRLLPRKIGLGLMAAVQRFLSLLAF